MVILQSTKPFQTLCWSSNHLIMTSESSLLSFVHWLKSCTDLAGGSYTNLNTNKHCLVLQDLLQKRYKKVLELILPEISDGSPIRKQNPAPLLSLLSEIYRNSHTHAALKVMSTLSQICSRSQSSAIAALCFVIFAVQILAVALCDNLQMQCNLFKTRFSSRKNWKILYLSFPGTVCKSPKRKRNRHLIMRLEKLTCKWSTQLFLVLSCLAGFSLDPL